MSNNSYPPTNNSQCSYFCASTVLWTNLSSHTSPCTVITLSAEMISFSPSLVNAHNRGSITVYWTIISSVLCHSPSINNSVVLFHECPVLLDTLFNQVSVVSWKKKPVKIIIIHFTRILCRLISRLKVLRKCRTYCLGVKFYYLRSAVRLSKCQE